MASCCPAGTCHRRTALRSSCCTALVLRGRLCFSMLSSSPATGTGCCCSMRVATAAAAGRRWTSDRTGTRTSRAPCRSFSSSPMSIPNVSVPSGCPWVAKRPSVPPHRMNESQQSSPKAPPTVSPPDKAWLSDEYGWRGTLQEGVEWLTYTTADLLTYRRPADRPCVTPCVHRRPGPVLLIEAGQPVDERNAGRYVQSAAPDSVELWIVPDAGHTEAIETAPDEWEARVSVFSRPHSRTQRRRSVTEPVGPMRFERDAPLELRPTLGGRGPVSRPPSRSARAFRFDMPWPPVETPLPQSTPTPSSRTVSEMSRAMVSSMSTPRVRGVAHDVRQRFAERRQQLVGHVLVTVSLRSMEEEGGKRLQQPETWVVNVHPPDAGEFPICPACTPGLSGVTPARGPGGRRG